MARTTIPIDARLDVIIEDGEASILTDGARYLPRHLVGALPDVAARVIEVLSALLTIGLPDEASLFGTVTPLEREVLARRGIPRR